jgi:hypothetical protein
MDPMAGELLIFLTYGQIQESISYLITEYLSTELPYHRSEPLFNA